MGAFSISSSRFASICRKFQQDNTILMPHGIVQFFQVQTNCTPFTKELCGSYYFWNRIVLLLQHYLILLQGELSIPILYHWTLYKQYYSL